MTSQSRRRALAVVVEQTAVDDGFAALDASPRGTPGRVAVLDRIARTLRFELVVARAMRKQATS